MAFSAARATLAIVVAGLALAAPAQGQQAKKAEDEKVEVQYDKTRDFSLFKSYAWVPFQEPLPNPARHIMMTRAVEAALEAKGLVKAETGADLFVHYAAHIDKKTRSTPARGESVWQTSNPVFTIDLSRIEIGTLVLELWEAKSKDVVWRGSGTSVLRSVAEREEQIKEAARKVLEPYPPSREKQE
jgi:hypothetical protein